MVDNDVISEAGLLEIMNAQPFAETRNDATRVWQLFGERVHVGDAIKAILAIAGHAELKQQLAAAREELATEKARLDWLDSEVEEFGWEGEELGRRWQVESEHKTVREAIDAEIQSFATLQRDRQP